MPARDRTATARRSGLAISAAIALASVLQAPGRITADTKIDLAIAPGRFLARALHLWQPEWALGQLQNQAVGYLFPMGPFFLVGDAARVPMWLVQRLWIALVVLVAFWGATGVARRLGIGTPATRTVAGAAYALSPAMLAFVGSTSGGQLPAALLPWVLIPLIDASAGGSPRRGAARSALAVVAMGGVNAASTLAALPLAGLWLVTRQPGPRRRRLLGWWLGSVTAATLWWSGALALQARYGFDFLPFTERADVTTGTTSAVEVMRGMGYWLSSLSTDGPWLPAGWMLAGHAVAIAGTVALTAAGLYGLARRDMPERTFLVAGVAFGTAVIAAGYGGPAGSAVAPAMVSLLDGVLSAFRNLHKFEPNLRLPLALALAHACAVLPVPSWRPNRRLVVAGAAAAVVAGSLPLLSGRLLQPGAFEELPGYWRQTAAWLDAHNEGRALVFPASEFAEYRWGRPLDEPLQPLRAGRWTARSLVPLGSIGATRVLDAVTRRIENGRADDLAEDLDRAGLRYLVVRNDLDPRRTTAPRPPVVRAALASTAGLRRVVSFGPTIADRPTSDRLHPSAAAPQRVRAVEIYEVTDPGPVVRATSGPPAVLSGGPEGVLSVTGLGDHPVVLAGDGPSPLAAPAILTDGQRLKDVDFGRIRDNLSYTLTSREAAPDDGGEPEDPVPVPGSVHRTAARMTGAAFLTASSYGPSPPRTPEGQPFAALDGDTSSGWVPSSLFGGVGQWMQITLDERRTIPHVDIRPLRNPGWRTQITDLVVSTDRGFRRVKLPAATDVQRVRLPAGATRAVRISIARVTGHGTAGAGLAELVLPGIEVRRPLALPVDQRRRLAAGAPLAGIHLTRSTVDPFDATRRDEEVRIDRIVETAGPATLELRGTAIGRPGPALSELVAGLAPTDVRVSTSSVWMGQPVYRGEAAVDDDPATAWVAGADDDDPEITLAWDGARTLRGLRLGVAPGPVAAPTRVRLSTGSEQRTVTVTGTAVVPFEPLTTDRVTVTVTARAAAPRGSRGLLTPVATAIGELELVGLDGLGATAIAPATPLEVPCGSGPGVSIDGVVHPTTARGTAGDLLEGRPLTVAGCAGPLTLGPGRHHVETASDGALAVNRLELVPPGPPAPARSRPTTVRTWQEERRTITLGPGPAAVLSTGENANDGWRATLDGRPLSPLRVDGWQQGWAVPSGAGGDVELTFGPGRWHRAALLAGAVSVLAVALLALLPPRRRRADLAPASGRTVPVFLSGGLATLAVALVCPPVAVAVPLLLAAHLAAGDDRLLPGVAGLSYALAGALVVLQPGRFPAGETGAYGAPAQVLTALALAALLTAAVAPERR